MDAEVVEVCALEKPPLTDEHALDACLTQEAEGVFDVDDPSGILRSCGQVASSDAAHDGIRDPEHSEDRLGDPGGDVVESDRALNLGCDLAGLEKFAEVGEVVVAGRGADVVEGLARPFGLDGQSGSGRARGSSGSADCHVAPAGLQHAETFGYLPKRRTARGTKMVRIAAMQARV